MGLGDLRFCLHAKAEATPITSDERLLPDHTFVSRCRNAITAENAYREAKPDKHDAVGGAD